MDLSSQHTPENIGSIHDNIMMNVSGAPKTTRKRCLQGMQQNLSKNVCNLNQLISQQETENDVITGAQTISMRRYKAGVGKSLLSEALFLSPLSPRFVLKNCVASYVSGPSCSKLTTSLVNDSLKFTSSDIQIC